MDPAAIASASARGSDDATTASVRKRIISLAGPAFIEYFLISFIGVVNMILVGGMGPSAIAAVGIVNQPVVLLQAGFMALSVGTTALVARFTGAREPESARAVAVQAIVVTLLLGLALTVPQIALAGNIVAWMGAGADVRALATGYMRVYVAGTVFLVMPLTMSAILRGAGDARTPMLLNILQGGMAAGLGYALIYGRFGFPALGINGAAVGTVTAMAVSTVLFTVSLYNRRSVVPLSLKDDHRPDAEVIRRILKIGLPAAIEAFIIRGGQTVFTRTVASLGTLAYAAHQLTSNAESLAFTPPQGFQVAATTLSGQYLGADEPETAQKSGYETLKMALMTMAVLGTLCLVFAERIIRIYTTNQDIISLALPNMRLFALALPGMATYFVLVGALRGAGDTRWPLYISVVCIWCVRVVGSYLFAVKLGFGLRGAWCVMVADHSIRAALAFVRFRSGKWRFQSV